MNAGAVHRGGVEPADGAAGSFLADGERVSPQPGWARSATVPKRCSASRLAVAELDHRPGRCMMAVHPAIPRTWIEQDIS